VDRTGEKSARFVFPVLCGQDRGTWTQRCSPTALRAGRLGGLGRSLMLWLKPFQPSATVEG
jgi:hypothetical protein